MFTEQERRERNREANKKFRLTHPDRIKEIQRQFNLRNPDKRIEYKNRWLLGHPDGIKEADKRWRDKYPERARECVRIWDSKNPEKGKARRTARAAVLRGDLTRQVKCQKCGGSSKRIEGHHYDYSRPLDLIWLCHKCHSNVRRSM
jgi:hypothetical protein